MRRRLVNVIKNFSLNVSSFRLINEEIVTSGGVPVKEIFTKIIEWRLRKGLFLKKQITSNT